MTFSSNRVENFSSLPPDWFERLHSGDPDQVMTLIESIDPLIQKMVCNPTKGIATADQGDVAQNVRLALLTALPRFEQSHERALLKYASCIIARRICDFQRKHIPRQQKTTSLDDPEYSPSGYDPATRNDENTPRSALASSDTLDHLIELLNTLDASCREIIFLRYIEAEKYAQIAEIRNVSTGAISSKIRQCLIKLKMICQNSDDLSDYFSSSAPTT